MEEVPASEATLINSNRDDGKRPIFILIAIHYRHKPSQIVEGQIICWFIQKISITCKEVISVNTIFRIGIQLEYAWKRLIKWNFYTPTIVWLVIIQVVKAKRFIRCPQSILAVSLGWQDCLAVDQFRAGEPVSSNDQWPDGVGWHPQLFSYVWELLFFNFIKKIIAKNEYWRGNERTLFTE